MAALKGVGHTGEQLTGRLLMLWISLQFARQVAWQMAPRPQLLRAGGRGLRCRAWASGQRTPLIWPIVVGFLGDGINDALALRHADVGEAAKLGRVVIPTGMHMQTLRQGRHLQDAVTTSWGEVPGCVNQPCRPLAALLCRHFRGFGFRHLERCSRCDTSGEEPHCVGARCGPRPPHTWQHDQGDL